MTAQPPAALAVALCSILSLACEQSRENPAQDTLVSGAEDVHLEDVSPQDTTQADTRLSDTRAEDATPTPDLGAPCPGGERLHEDACRPACIEDADCIRHHQLCVRGPDVCTPSSLPCVRDEDCLGGDAGYVCDATVERCVASCRIDSHCPETQYCDATGHCLAGCREGGCEAPQICDHITRACGLGCDAITCSQRWQICSEESGQCQPPSTSSGERGLCYSCGYRKECALGLSCVSGRCTLPCVDDADCPPSYICGIQDGTTLCVPDAPVSCPSNAAEHCLLNGCPEGFTCRPDDGRCVIPQPPCSPCSRRWACGDDARCVEGVEGRSRCVPRCDAERACPDGWRCDDQQNLCALERGACVDCELNEASCAESGAHLDPDSCRCVDCLTDDDCDPGFLCAQALGVCMVSDEHCFVDESCSFRTPDCIGAEPNSLEGICHNGCRAGGCPLNQSCDETLLLCQTCDCPDAQVCWEGGPCVDVHCDGDQECQDLLGAYNAACDPSVRLCYLKGSCQSPQPSYLAPCKSQSCLMSSDSGELQCGCVDDDDCRGIERCVEERCR